MTSTVDVGMKRSIIKLTRTATRWYMVASFHWTSRDSMNDWDDNMYCVVWQLCWSPWLRQYLNTTGLECESKDILKCSWKGWSWWTAIMISLYDVLVTTPILVQLYMHKFAIVLSANFLLYSCSSFPIRGHGYDMFWVYQNKVLCYLPVPGHGWHVLCLSSELGKYHELNNWTQTQLYN
jgi:hypothetical protein